MIVVGSDKLTDCIIQERMDKEQISGINQSQQTHNLSIHVCATRAEATCVQWIYIN